MSLATLFFAVLGVFSGFIFFFLMRFKASAKQLDRDNRIKWSRFFPYKEAPQDPTNGDLESKKDAEFKD